MQVDGVFEIARRGTTVTGTWDSNTPVRKGDTVRRKSDGAEWRVAGIEQFAMYIGRDLVHGRECGLLLDGAAKADVGDEIERVPS